MSILSCLKDDVPVLVIGDVNDGSDCFVEDGGYVPYAQQIEELLATGIRLDEQKRNTPYDSTYLDENITGSPAYSRDYNEYDNKCLQAQQEYVLKHFTVKPDEDSGNG